MNKYFLAILVVFSFYLKINAQFGSAPPGEIWTPYAQNIDNGLR